MELNAQNLENIAKKHYNTLKSFFNKLIFYWESYLKEIIILLLFINMWVLYFLEIDKRTFTS